MSKSQQVYDLLHKKITMLEFKPGEPLSEPRLMSEFGVGRTPLREAIQRLIMQGLVIAYPRQAPTVAPVQAGEVAQIVEMRTVLEVATVRLAAQRATKEDIQRLSAASDEYARATEEGDPIAIVMADAAFHQGIAEATHNRYLSQTVAWNRDFGCRLWCMSIKLGGSMHADGYKHGPIIELIARRDADAAEAAIRQHIGLMHQRLNALLNGETALDTNIREMNQT